MKSLREYTMNLPEQAYHEFPAWSYSMIADYAKNGFAALATIHDIKQPTPSMEFGSLFDSILTHGRGALDEYVVSTTELDIAPAEKEVMDKLLAKHLESNYVDLVSNHLDDLNAVIESCESFCSKYKKYETRYLKLNAVSNYYNMRATGKKIVSKADWDDAVQMALCFRNTPSLNSLFGTKDTEDKEYIYQAQFLVRFKMSDGKDVAVKCMFDLIVVDHKNKTIQPVDLKTSTVPAYSFAENFVKFRYDLQAAVYVDVLEIKLTEIPEYKDYTILPFMFVDISRSDKIPVRYVYNPTAEDQVLGFTYTIKDKTYKCRHWTTLLCEIIDYEDSKAVVPNGISLEEPNDILTAISRL